VALQDLETFLIYSVWEVASPKANQGQRRESQSFIQWKLHLKIYIMAKIQKLPWAETEFVLNVKAEEVRLALSRHVKDVMVKVWELSCKCLDLECTLKEQVLVMNAMDKVNKLMRKTNARIAMVRKLSKKRKSLMSKLIKVLLMERSIYSTVRLTSSQEWNLAM